MAAFRTLKIKSFRGIRDLSIENIGLVNLIVGDNNCGKTSVLEAIQLFSSTASLSNVYKIAKQRESIFGANANTIYENFIYMFPKNNEGFDISVGGNINNMSIDYHITGKESRIFLDSNEMDRLTKKQIEAPVGRIETDVFDGIIEYKNGNIVKNQAIHINRYSKISGMTVSPQNNIRIVYVSPFEHLSGNTISMIIKNDGYKAICLKALQIFDADIEDMMLFRSDIGDKPIEYLKHKKLGNMPLSTYGDGIKKVLVLSNAIAVADGGILLIDEIETAIHKKYYDDIFRFIIKACKAFNVQLFITTHSLEAIDGLLGTQDYNEQRNSDDITVVTLKKENTRTYSRVISGRQVAENREAFGFEVRL